MRNRKQTAWRKNRKFGDIHGGRAHAKITDRIFNRAHSLSPPGPGQETPILIEDNPSRDYFFPMTGAESVEAIQELPKRDHTGITHVWHRRVGSRHSRDGGPLGQFICGSGVRLVVMYPWRRDMRICLGRQRPQSRVTKEFERYGARLFRARGWWYVEFTLDQLRRFWIFILYHEIGHHVDWYHRHWSSANHRQVEEFADQYAMSFTKTGTYVLNRMNKRSNE